MALAAFVADALITVLELFLNYNIISLHCCLLSSWREN